MSPYVRTVKTGSGATAVQIVHSSRRGSRDIEHIGSAHDEAEAEVLKAAARQRLVGGQDELELGLERTEPARRGSGGGPLPITASRMGHLWDALSHAYDELGFGRAAGQPRPSCSRLRGRGRLVLVGLVGLVGLPGDSGPLGLALLPEFLAARLAPLGDRGVHHA